VNNDVYLTYFLNQRRMPAPSVKRERTGHSVWSRARKALATRCPTPQQTPATRRRAPCRGLTAR
jgi:hypothetical protein